MNKFPKRYFLTLIWTFHTNLIVWSISYLLFGLILSCKHFWTGLVLQFQIDKDYLLKFKNKKFTGLNLGHTVIIVSRKANKDGIDTSIEKHEHGHAEQWEGNCLFSFLIASVVFSISIFVGNLNAFLYFILFVWFFGGYVIYFCRSVQAWIRGENIYSGNADEESMRAQFK